MLSHIVSIKKMDDVIATISTRKGRYSDTYSLTRTELIWQWTKGEESGESSISLSKLKPRVEHASSRPRGTEQRLITGIILVALAAVIFFSALQKLAPLLSVLLALGGCTLIVWAFRKWRVLHYSGFATKDDEWFGHVIHSRCDSHELEQFEAAFEDACESARFESDS
ncbi:MAG: hypothetical protein MI807_06765 [Verrucomicrobiales bacterium]|nr:hypothetical protein [Verrucomicrobiales bacterium]